MLICLPENVARIIERLNQAGYEAYAVGGCVRDSLLHRVPMDWDITTSALPEETKAIFPRTIDTGIEHGTVTVMMGREGYETTTYRIDGKYSDSRHPDSVSFTRSLEEDLKRRDFTINAMAYRDGELVDLFGGVSDLESHVIRCVGDPRERFREDALRILRAVRFSAQLGFDIETETATAAASLAGTLTGISAERIHVELHKLLLSAHPDRLRTMHELGIDKVILPELSLQADSPGFDRLLTLLAGAPADSYVRWAMLLGLTGHAKEIMQRLKFDNLTINTVTELIRLTQTPLVSLDRRGMRYLMNDAGADHMELLFAYRQAIDPDTDLSSPIGLYRDVVAAGECTALKELMCNGRDLMDIGVPAGKTVGRALDMLLLKVLNDPGLNDRETLLQICRKEYSL